MPHESRSIGGYEHLAIAHSEDHGAAVPRDNQGVGALGVQHGDTVCASYELQRRPNRFLQRVTANRRNEVGEDFGIRFGTEFNPLGAELRTQCRCVLDDPVVDDGESVVCVGVWMGVAIARLAMRGPAGVADARSPFQAFRQKALQFPHLAFALVDAQRSIAHHGQPGRVVPPVLEAMQPFHQNRRRVLASDVAHDSTHAQPLSAVDHSADLSRRVFRCTKAPRRQLFRQAHVDRGIRNPLRLQRAMAPADKILRGLLQVAQYLCHHSPRLGG